jgi:hypothetical protein
MMRGLVDLAKTAEDERVRSVCLIAVLDRAGVRLIDYGPPIGAAAERKKFDPSLYSPEELDLIERALRLMTGEQKGVGAIGSRGDRASAACSSGSPVFEQPLVEEPGPAGLMLSAEFPPCLVSIVSSSRLAVS